MPTTLNKYRVWCNTENMYYEIWGEIEPVACPNNSGHEIDSTKISIVYTLTEEEKRDTSGKMRVHQTSRPLGTKVHFTSRGDDPSNIALVGGGEKLSFNHHIADGLQHVKYLDFNTIENLSYIHEGYLSWKNCEFDEITVEIVPRIVTTTPDANTGTGYFVNPAAPYIVLPSALAGGASNVDINEDLTDPTTPGLIFIPEAGDPQFGKPPAYWDTDWNSTTKLFENIRPMPAGDGNYNIFTMEITFSRFANHIQLVGDNAIQLKTSDTDKIGHGMRVRVTVDTNIDDGDHDYHIGCILTMHRQKSVAG